MKQEHKRLSKRIGCSLSLIFVVCLMFWPRLSSDEKQFRELVLGKLNIATKVEALRCETDYDETVMGRYVYFDDQAHILNKTEIAELAEVFDPKISFSFFYFLKACFKPHHAVRMTMPDGRLFMVWVCFDCGWIRSGYERADYAEAFDETKIQDEESDEDWKSSKLTPPWKGSWKSFFDKRGMPEDWAEKLEK